MGLLEPSFGRVELDGHNALADLPEYKKRLSTCRKNRTSIRI
jgi:hypothetical protein